MYQKILIAGGGIGGLAAAIASCDAGWQVNVMEKVADFAEVGAGVQLGPNVTRHLHRWQLKAKLDAVASYPGWIVVRSALSGKVLATMPLGADFMQRYGAPYATLHRADLHGVLLAAAQDRGCDIYFGRGLAQVEQLPEGVRVHLDAAKSFSTDARDKLTAVSERQISHADVMDADVLVGADGLWSQTRQLLPHTKQPVFMGHMAHRMLIDQQQLTLAMRSSDVTVWMGPCLHAVFYPVCGGQSLNAVLIRHSHPAVTAPAVSTIASQTRPDSTTWLGVGDTSEITAAVSGMCSALQDMVQAVLAHCSHVGSWPLYAAEPVQNEQGMAFGRIALLGDAAHPMLPYLAQGAGMAIEDAIQLERSLSFTHLDAASRLQHYAQQRWQRNATVQARAQRNGRIFHLKGLPALARNAALRWMGARIMDMPWLYGGGPPVND